MEGGGEDNNKLKERKGQWVFINAPSQAAPMLMIDPIYPLTSDPLDEIPGQGRQPGPCGHAGALVAHHEGGPWWQGSAGRTEEGGGEHAIHPGANPSVQGWGIGDDASPIVCRFHADALCMRGLSYQIGVDDQIYKKIYDAPARWIHGPGSRAIPTGPAMVVGRAKPSRAHPAREGAVASRSRTKI